MRMSSFGVRVWCASTRRGSADMAPIAQVVDRRHVTEISCHACRSRHARGPHQDHGERPESWSSAETMLAHRFGDWPTRVREGRTYPHNFPRCSSRAADLDAPSPGPAEYQRSRWISPSWLAWAGGVRGCPKAVTAPVAAGSRAAGG